MASLIVVFNLVYLCQLISYNSFIMDFVFDCFFEEILQTIERSGLKTRQNRQNVIDQLDAVIAGCSAGKHAIDTRFVHNVKNIQYQSGQDVPPEEASRLAVESAIKYHRMIKVKNSEVRKKATL